MAMGKNSNKIKHEILGESFGKASGKLKRTILFSLVQKLGLDFCYRCGQKIENIKIFSIDHKESWQLAQEPVKAFYDLDNITFSHLSCNIEAAVRTPQIQLGEKNGNAKLTNNAVLNIKKDLKQGIKQSEIAKKYKISTGTISSIATEKYWKHIISK